MEKYTYTYFGGFSGGSVVMSPRQETGVQSLGQEDPLEKGTATPLWYSGLENSMDRGAWRTTVYGVSKESDMT